VNDQLSVRGQNLCEILITKHRLLSPQSCASYEKLNYDSNVAHSIC